MEYATKRLEVVAATLSTLHMTEGKPGIHGMALIAAIYQHGQKRRSLRAYSDLSPY